ncbi:MAG: DNA-binding response regulator [Nocardioides sp.]|nr:DNA-binding response regulator [Nocardioides sp.]
MLPPRPPFAGLGLDLEDERLYRRILPCSGLSPTDCAAALEVEDVADLRRRVAGLVAIGGVEFDTARDVVRVEPPARLLASRVASESQALRDAAARLDQLREAIPTLREMLADPLTPGDLSAGDLLAGGDIPALLESWIHHSSGELLWLRPDQWRMPSESPMRSAVASAVATGRRCRAIYPARVLEKAPDVVLERMAMGEEVRIVAEVPSRMAIIGDAGVLLPEVWGENNDRRVRVRQPGLRIALTALFDEMWDRGLALGTPADSRDSPALTSHQSRRLLLEQLASGAKDEQMARALGVSLRTVRRRVADVLVELGVNSRFQAGVEAVRRGWI